MSTDSFRYGTGPKGSGWVTSGSPEIVEALSGLIGEKIKVTELYSGGTVIGHRPMEGDRWLVVGKPAQLSEIHGRVLTQSDYEALGFDPFRTMAEILPHDEMLRRALITGPEIPAAELNALDRIERAKYGRDLVAPDSVSNYLSLAYAVFLAGGDDRRKEAYWSALPNGSPPDAFPLCRFAQAGRRTLTITSVPKVEGDRVSGNRSLPDEPIDTPVNRSPVSVRSEPHDVLTVLKRAEAVAEERAKAIASATADAIARTAAVQSRTSIETLESELDRLKDELETATRKIGRLGEKQGAKAAIDGHPHRKPSLVALVSLAAAALSCLSAGYAVNRTSNIHNAVEALQNTSTEERLKFVHASQDAAAASQAATKKATGLISDAEKLALNSVGSAKSDAVATAIKEIADAQKSALDAIGTSDAPPESSAVAKAIDRINDAEKSALNAIGTGDPPPESSVVAKAIDRINGAAKIAIQCIQAARKRQMPAICRHLTPEARQIDQ
jgi:hypothetical protein